MNPLCICVVLAALLFAGPAWAHAHLVTSEPAADASVAAPATLELHFSQAIVKKSTVTITGPDKKAVAIKAIDLKDEKTVVVTPAAPLAPGRYTVSWIAITDGDGHKTDGTYAFTVQ